MVDLSAQQLQEILKLELNTTGSVTQEKSTFRAYIGDVRNFVDIRKMYIKAKLLEPAARHIVCAYYLEGKEHHYDRNYCDDGEPGAGKNLLELLVRNEIKNKVLFVARHFGGVKMGADRFDCYVSAAKIVLKEFPHSKIFKRTQEFKDIPPQTKKSTKLLQKR